MLEPQQQLLRLAGGMQVSAALQVVTALCVPDLLKDGPVGIERLATETGSNEDALYRVLRLLAALGLFTESDARAFGLTPLSEPLREDHPRSVRPMVLWLGDPASWHAWGLLAYGIRTGRSTFEHALGMNVFEYLAKNPATAERFDLAMANTSARVAPAVAEAYDFSGLGRVVDVAGGTGILLRAILDRHAALHGVLYDLPEVIARARAVHQDSPLAERLDFATGSFFEKVPEGADAYLLKNILHDWDDESCVRILRNCRDALAEGGKVLAVEEVLTEGTAEDRQVTTRALDLQMLVMTPGGRQRSEAEFSALFAKAGLKLGRIILTEAGPSVLEATRAEAS